MNVDTSLIRAKLYAAISDQAGAQRQPFQLRPSNIGQCPLRLRFESEGAAGGIMSEPREGRFEWAAYQGKVSEELMALLLEAAGAEVIHPPNDSDVWDERVAPDPETGFKPHLDSLIRWPSVGISDWCILELKNLRAIGHNDLIYNGLYAERVYWFQSVSYLMTALLAIENYAKADPFGPWAQLHHDGVAPKGILFVSSAKDPASANMFIQQKLATPQYELRPPPKGYTDKQLAMMQLRKVARERFEKNDSDPSFYFEFIDRLDPSVTETWEDILNVKQQVEQSSRPEPIHDITVPEDQLAAECRWYCPYLEQHRAIGLTLLEQLTVSVDQLRQAQEQEQEEEN